MKIRIALFSDTHMTHKRVILPECDMALFGGDLSHTGKMHEVLDFMDWYDRQHQATDKFWVAGNHDKSLDPDLHTGGLLPQWLSNAMERYTNIQYLYNSAAMSHGLKIWGSPVTPNFFPEYWAFNKDRGEEIREVWQSIPEDTDILISHGPAKGFLDWVPMEYDSPQYPAGHVGCIDLRDRIYQLPQLKVMLVGHIHNNTGVETIPIGNRELIYINGAVVDNHNYFQNQPITIGLDI